MDIQAYLNRINYRGAIVPALDTLSALQRMHMLTVPFENLDIGLKRPIILDEARLYDKIVTRRRGGFCYELNGLFAALLRTLGFNVSLLSASVARSDGTFGIPFDHMALCVQLDARWLVDVGFGDSFMTPLRLDDVGIQHSEFRLVPDGEHLIYSRREEGRWNAQYRLSLQPYALADFHGGCHYHQTSPDSTFTRRRVCSRATPAGRITLSNMKLIVTQQGVKTEQPLANEAAFTAALREHFGVELAI